MAENIIESALAVINQYPEISIIESTEITIIMDIKNARFCLWLPPCDYNDKMPLLTAVEQSGSFPHLLTEGIELYGQNHRRICLYESESIVKSLFSSCEKINFIIRQLVRLLNLSPSQQEQEYQKEFLMCWNRSASSPYEVELFIATSDKHCWLNVYDDKNTLKQLVHPDIHLNNIAEKHLNTNVQALYIPIIDVRGIVPPDIDNGWTVADVLSVLDNKQFSRISVYAFNELLTCSYSKQTIFFVFEMPANNATVTFCCEIAFKNAGTMKLINKIKTNTECIRAVHTTRCDYEFLNIQIGNDLALIGKRVAIIGVGSLGGYISSEIVRTGIKNIVLIDNDSMNPENLMRHRGSFPMCNVSKSKATKLQLEWFHPEISVTAINNKVNAENIIDLLPQDVDLVIFAVGSTDVQLECNRQFKHLHYNKPVLYCWLEGNGKASHVLGIDYSKQGCYQCLYTDTAGNMINNKVNVVSETELEQNIIRNGCGGTRIAYGNGILLQTAYIALTAIKKIFSDSFECNFLISLNGNTITEDADSFYEGSCACCNED